MSSKQVEWLYGFSLRTEVSVLAWISFLGLQRLLTLIMACFSGCAGCVSQCSSSLEVFSLSAFKLNAFFFLRTTLKRCCVLSFLQGGSGLLLLLEALRNLLEYYLMGTMVLFSSFCLSFNILLGCYEDRARLNSCRSS